MTAIKHRLGLLAALFDDRERRRFKFFFGAVFLMSMSQMTGLILVLPFLRLLAAPVEMDQSAAVSLVTRALGPMSPSQLAAVFGIGVVSLLIVSAAFSVAALWHQYRLGATFMHSLSMRLSACYQKVPYQFHLETNSSELIRRSIEDVNAVVTGVVIAGSQFLSSLLTGALILLLLFVVNFWATLVLVLVFGGLFGGLFVLLRSTIARLGYERLAVGAVRYQTFVELLRGVKTIKSFGAQQHFLTRFEQPSLRFNQIEPRISFVSAAPRFVIEALILSSAVIVAFLSFGSGEGQLGSGPMILFFVLAGIRLIPAFAQAYTSLTTLMSNLPSVEKLHRDLNVAQGPEPVTLSEAPFSQRLSLDTLTFAYRPSDPPVVRQVSLTIRRGEKVALVGPSGSGKSTVIDLVAGLLTSSQGRILIDDLPLGLANVASWQAQVGYVPQDVFLIDDTIAANVAFGAATIDEDRVAWACEMAQLSDFLASLGPDGMYSVAGEQGLRLSGGQRQRIGLARALYRDPSVLLLDEATSALDAATEKQVIAALRTHLAHLTIVMIAHRMSTVRHCDRLYLMDRGAVVATGTYEDLFESNQLFREISA